MDKIRKGIRKNEKFERIPHLRSAEGSVTEARYYQKKRPGDG